jgi:competence protein ComEC
VLPGDIPGAVERQLARTAQPCGLLKLAHHGSRSSSDPAWLERLRPTLAVASAGRRRRGALPHPEVRARLEARQVTVYVTREHGAVEVSFTPYGLVAVPFLP